MRTQKDIIKKKQQIEESKKIYREYQKLKKEFNELNKSVCLSFKVRPDDRNKIMKYCTKRKIYPSEFFRDTILKEVKKDEEQKKS